MKNTKKILFSTLLLLALVFICALSTTVNAKVKEDSTLFSNDVYIIGSTRFNGDFIITASRAAIAGADEAFVQYNVYNNINFKSSDIKTYYYCALDESWNEVETEEGTLKELSQEEAEKLEKQLNIFFVNNVEKTIEVPFSGIIDDDSIVGGQNGEAKIEDNKIIIPATWVNGFSFTSEGTQIDVILSNFNENNEMEELKEPEVKKQPTMAVTVPSSVYVGENLEFSVNFKANDFENEKVRININTKYNGNQMKVKPVEKIEYYDETAKAWKEVEMYSGNGIKIDLKTGEAKFRAIFNCEGNYTLQVNANLEDNYIMISSELKNVNATVNPKAVAKVNSKYYETIKEAVENATDSTVTLLKDITITERLNVTNDITLDLGGHTINIEGTNNRIAAQQNANVTIKNGNVISNTNYGLQSQDNAILNIAKDLNIKVSGTDGNAEQYGVTLFHKATLNFEGSIVVERTGRFACGISGNGSEPETTNTTVNILGGSIKVEEGVAIYHPQVGKLNIKDGTLEANTTLGIKSGEIDISGGTLKATGVKNDADAMRENIKLTGDTVYIEQNTAYYGHVSVNITGGQLTSANGYIMQEFNPTIGTEKERNAVVTGMYTKPNKSSINCTYYTAE